MNSTWARARETPADWTFQRSLKDGTRASTVPDPSAGCPVAVFHRAYGVEFVAASVNDTAVSRSGGAR